MKFWQSIGHLARKWVTEKITGNWKFEPTTGKALEIDQNNDAMGLHINNGGEEQAIYVNQSKALASGKQTLQIYDNVAETSASYANVIQLDNAASTAQVLKLVNDGTGANLNIDQNGEGKSLVIDSEADSSLVIEVSHQKSSNGNILQIQHASDTNGIFAAKWLNAISRHGLILGNGTTNYKIWVDNNGDLRIHTGDPTAHDDGTVVGTQT